MKTPRQSIFGLYNTFIGKKEKLIVFTAISNLREFPIRGALVKGDLHVNRSILVEKSIARAAYLEKIQDWAGVIIDSSCFEDDATNELRGNLSFDQLIVYEDVSL